MGRNSAENEGRPARFMAPAYSKLQLGTSAPRGRWNTMITCGYKSTDSRDMELTELLRRSIAA